MNPRTAEKIYSMTLLAMRLVMMNLLWFLFTALGGIVFGVIPATVVVVSVFRDDRMKDDVFSWFQVAWRRYPTALRRFAGLSVMFFLFFTGAFLSYRVDAVHHMIPKFAAIVVLIWLSGLFLPYLAVNESHMEVSRLAAVRNSLLLPLLWPLSSVRLLSSEIAVGLLCRFVPALIPLVGISVPLYLATWFLTERWDSQLRRLGMNQQPVGEENVRETSLHETIV